MPISNHFSFDGISSGTLAISAYRGRNGVEPTSRETHFLFFIREASCIVRQMCLKASSHKSSCAISAREMIVRSALQSLQYKVMVIKLAGFKAWS